MMQRHLKIVTLLVLCGVIALSAAAFGGQGATSVKGSAAATIAPPARVEVAQAAPLSWLARTLRLQLGIWFGVQIDPPVTRGGKPAVTTPAEDGPVKSQSGSTNRIEIGVAYDTGGAGAEK